MVTSSGYAHPHFIGEVEVTCRVTSWDMTELGSHQVHSGHSGSRASQERPVTGPSIPGPPATWDRDEEDTAGTGRDWWQENGSGSGVEWPAIHHREGRVPGSCPGPHGD